MSTPRSARLVFFSALLIFAAEPLLGSLLLPFFGGGPSVWTTLLMCFTLWLFLGYLLAAKLSTLQPGIARLYHRLFLGLATLSLFLPPSLIMSFSPSSPLLGVCLHAFLLLGLPFLLLSTTFPLLSRLLHSPGLYWLSNLGSLVGLLIFPFLLSPLLTLNAELILWKIGFVVYLAELWRFPQLFPPTDRNPVSPIVHPLPPLFLAFFPAALLTSLTAFLTQNLPSVPLLWLPPLAIYLLSFVFAFRFPKHYLPTFHLTIGSFLLGLLGLVIAGLLHVPFVSTFIFGLFCLFALSFIFHSELARREPSSLSRPRFYVYVALGSLLATIFTAVVAPLAFPSLWELPLTVLGSLLCLAWLTLTHPWRSPQITAFPLFIFLLCAVLFRPLFESRPPGLVGSKRNFFGLLQIADVPSPGGTYRLMRNGNINHGGQFLVPTRNLEATTYYQTNSGLGLAITALINQAGTSSLHIGTIGLGVGTTASYCRAGDVYDFYEINPVVIQASDKYFTYLKNCRDLGGIVHLIQGDGRLALQKTRSDFLYDLLSIDAFTSDAIPTHLITLEATKLYLAHLKPNGVLAFHITNGFLDLSGVLAREAALLGLHTQVVTTTDSTWYLLSRVSTIGSLALAPTSSPHRVWTDDYTNLLPYLRLH